MGKSCLVVIFNVYGKRNEGPLVPLISLAIFAAGNSQASPALVYLWALFLGISKRKQLREAKSGHMFFYLLAGFQILN